MKPDPTYKRIFAHEFMVEELMRWFVADLISRARARADSSTRSTSARCCDCKNNP